MNKHARRREELTDFGGHVPPQPLSPVSEEKIQGVERELGHSLPADYREFLKDYGNLTIGSGVDFSDREWNGPAYGGCEFFYGVDTKNDWSDLLTRYKNQGEDRPSDFLPISEADNGSMFIVLSGEEKGAVYFWHRGQGGGDLTPEHIYFVAALCDKFMGLLVT